MADPASMRVTTTLPWLLLLVFGVMLSLQDIRTFDYWWHLRTGALIAETGSVPKFDPYTYTVPGARWIDIHWLHQLGLHGLYSLGGHAAVVVGKAVFTVALVAVLATIGVRRQRPLVSVAALGLMLLVIADRLMPRPELPTFVCLAGVLALLDRYARRPDLWVYGIVAIQLVWVNVHGLFALGIAVCGIAWVSELLRPLVAPGQALRPARLRRLGAVTALAALASLANPNGLDGALYPIQQLGMIGPPEQRGVFGSLIAELIPLFSEQRPQKPFALATTGLLTLLSALAMLLNWRRLSAADPLLWVAFAYLALGASRNLALFALVAAPITVRNLNDWLDARGGGVASPRLRLAATAVVSLALLGFSVDTARGDFFERLGSYRSFGLGTMDVFYPTGAAEWIASERPPGPIAHHMAAGGYLIWRLHPDYPVMVDGRLEVFGQDRFVELQTPSPERFRKLDQEYRFGMVLVHYSLVPSADLLWWLYLNSNWRLAFLDDVAALFVRVPDEGLGGQVDIDIDDPDVFPPLSDQPGPSDLVRRFARTNFWMSTKRWKPALELWQETVERYPDLPQGPIIHALLLDRNRLSAAAEAILRELLAAEPDSPTLHAQVGDLRLAAGDTDAARTLYEEALRLDPNLPHAMYRRAGIAEADGDPQQAVKLYMRIVARSHPADPLAIGARTRLLALGGAL